MTNDEAIELLSHLFMLRTLSGMADDYNEALCMAIDALRRKKTRQPDILHDEEIYLSPGMVWNTDEKQIEELVRAELSERLARKLTKGKAIKKRLDTVSGMYVYSFGKEEYGNNDKQ